MTPATIAAMRAQAAAAGRADEALDMGAELQRTFAPTSSDIAKIPLTQMAPNDVRQVIHYIDDVWQQTDAFQKAIMVHESMDQEKRRETLGKRGPISTFVDRLGIWGYDSAGLATRPGPVGYESLRAIVEQVPIFNACILTRIRQVQTFCRPVEREFDIGFQVVRRYVQREYSKDGDGDLDWRRWMARYFVNSGDVFSPIGRKKLKRDTLTAYMAKVIRDIYQYDAPSTETERNAKKEPCGFYALDGATIRLVTTDGEEVKGASARQAQDSPFAVQLLRQVPVTAFGHEHLIYEPTNPRTDVNLGGYGYPATEMLVRAATGYLNALMLNIKGHDENRIPPGLLLLFGDFSREDSIHFQQEWNMLARGVNRRWTLPMMMSKNREAGADYVKFGMEFNEMYFARWMTFLTALICAILGMDPTEVNFESFAVNKSTLSGGDTAEKLASSRDKGLEPLLSYLANVFTDYLVSAYDDDYEFRWRGLHPTDMDRRMAAVEKVGTVNEYRELAGLDPVPDDIGWGEVPVNPVLAQYVVPTIEALQPPQPQMPGGMPPDQEQANYAQLNADDGGMSDDQVAAAAQQGENGSVQEQQGAPDRAAEAAQKPKAGEKGMFGKASTFMGRFRKALIEVVG